MTSIAFAVPGSLDTPTGGYRYDRRVIAELRACGMTVELVTLLATFPDPPPPDLAAAEALIDALPAGLPVIIDGLAFGVMSEAAERLARRRRLIALVHHPLALETGLTPVRATTLAASERTALRHADAVIVTSPATAGLLAADYGVSAGRISVALPGIEHTARPARDPTRLRSSGRFRFLSVGSLIPRKGYLDLLKAYAQIADLDWEAEIVGDPGLDSGYAREVAAAIARHRLRERVHLAGALDETDLEARFMAADCFVLASHYEGYGMAFAEAIAAGLPVVGTTGGGEAIGHGGAMVAPGDVDALASALRGIISDKTVHEDLVVRSRRRAAELPRWSDAAAVIARVIRTPG